MGLPPRSAERTAAETELARSIKVRGPRSRGGRKEGRGIKAMSNGGRTGVVGKFQNSLFILIREDSLFYAE